MLLCSVSFLILKQGVNEQVEMISPRIYEQASNPANCHGGGPEGSGGELIFPVLWAAAAFSNCVTEQGRYLVVVLHGSLLWGGTWGSGGLTPANTHLCSLL